MPPIDKKPGALLPNKYDNKTGVYIPKIRQRALKEQRRVDYFPYLKAFKPSTLLVINIHSFSRLRPRRIQRLNDIKENLAYVNARIKVKLKSKIKILKRDKVLITEADFNQMVKLEMELAEADLCSWLGCKIIDNLNLFKNNTSDVQTESKVGDLEETD